MGTHCVRKAKRSTLLGERAQAVLSAHLQAHTQLYFQLVISSFTRENHEAYDAKL